MTAESNADGKPSEKVEGEEVLRTVECLRGRLLAERAASRDAKEEADQLEKKLIELESRLKEETKSRNRSEKRLKSLMKKLESLEIFYVSDETEQSGFLEKTEISSASSVASTSIKEAQNNKLIKINPTHNIEEQPGLQIPNSEFSSFPDVGSRPNNVSQISVSSSDGFVIPDENSVQGCCQETSGVPKLSTSSSVEHCPEIPSSKETSSSVTEEDIANSCTIASTAKAKLRVQNY